MAGSRSRSSNADKEAGGTSSATTSKSTRSSRRAAAAAAAAAAAVADGPGGHSRTGTPDVHENGDSGAGQGGSSAALSSSAASSSSSANNKPSGLETNTITYKANEFLAGLSSAANPVRRELAIELLGKPTVVAIETHGLLNQPLVGTMPVNGNNNNNGASVTIPPGMALTSSGLITSTASSAGCGAAALVAAAAVVDEQPNIAATAEIEDLPVDALRRYKAAYKIPQLGAQSFNGYLLNSAVGRKTWSYRIGKSNNRVPKATLAQAVRRNFGNHSVRESDVIVDFIYSVKTQDNAFKCRII